MSDTSTMPSKKSAPKPKSPRFSSRTFGFLKEAGRQKHPTWLDRNRARYETALLHPLQALASQLKRELGAAAPGYNFPQKGLGRMRRSANWLEKGDGIYKNWVTYQAARPRSSRFESNPNLYFMIDMNDPVDTVLVAGGLYAPSSRQLRGIREAIATNAEPFEQLFADREFRRHFKGGFSHDRAATRPPRGYDPSHPKMDWLKLQAFFVWKPYTRKQLTSPGFAKILAADWRQIARLNELLDQAIARRLTAVSPGLKTKLADRLEGIQAPQRVMDF